VGRAGSTGAKDLAIPESFELYNSLYVFAGSTLNSGTQGMTYMTTDPAVLQTLVAPSVAGDNERGFGSRAVGDIDVVGVSSTDLVVSYPNQSSVQIYADRTGAGFPAYGSTAFNITEPTSFMFGNDFQVVDWNGDGHPDLFVGTYTDTTPLLTTGLFIYPNRGVPMKEFTDTPMTGLKFFRSMIPPLSGSGSAMGGGVVLGDFNNDGKLDLATSDHLDGTGKVFVWQ
jgi:hypothetical protein